MLFAGRSGLKALVLTDIPGTDLLLTWWIALSHKKGFCFLNVICKIYLSRLLAIFFFVYFPCVRIGKNTLNTFLLFIFKIIFSCFLEALEMSYLCLRQVLCKTLGVTEPEVVVICGYVCLFLKI